MTRTTAAGAVAAMRVRRAERADAPALLTLMDALADYEKLDRPDAGARERLIQDAFERDPPRFQVYLAEEDTESGHGDALGYAIVLETYSSFLARPTLYLEDIFVRPEARCRGVGSALFAHLAREAQARGCGRMEWVVLDWNELAQQFYQKRGARHLNDWQYYRLDAEGIARLNNTGYGEVTDAPSGLEKETNKS